jgi:alpha-L-fucosidase
VPHVLINNRLGLKRADFNTIEGKLPGKAPKGVWEYCWNLGVFWGYNPRNYAAKQMKTPEHYIETLVNTASMGGNYLLNVGPDPTGCFHPMALDYLNRIGEWVNANEECIRGVCTSPLSEKPAWGYLTQREGRVYLIVKDWPVKDGALVMPSLGKRLVRAYLLRDPAKRSLAVTTGLKQWTVTPGGSKPDEPFTVIALEVGSQLASARDRNN